MGLKLHQVKTLSKVDELFEKNWLSAILLRDNSHLLIFSRRVIIYGSETSPCESSPQSR